VAEALCVRLGERHAQGGRVANEALYCVQKPLRESVSARIAAPGWRSLDGVAAKNPLEPYNEGQCGGEPNAGAAFTTAAFWRRSGPSPPPQLFAANI
jgi:hypothetical protein